LDLFLDRGPAGGLEKRIFETAQHIFKHLIWHGKRQLIGFIKFGCRPPISEFLL
jgi:hypothetical protein